MSRIPITIGIVGHKDVVITNEHKDSIESIFDDISRGYPNSPICLFSQLAIGADTEVAKIFIAYAEKHNIDYSLVVPLPYDKKYYEKTQFTTEKEIDDFHNLVAKSDRTFELNQLTASIKASIDRNPTEQIDELSDYYKTGGEFVADSAIILIALWEEYDNKLVGGSAGVVAYKRINDERKIANSKSIFDSEGSLISIPCNRGDSNKSLNLKANYFNDLIQDRSIHKALEKIEELNISSLQIEDSDINQSMGYLYPLDKELSENNKKLRSIYALVDSVANGHQNRYNSIMKGLFGLGFIILCVFESYKHLGLKSWLFFLMVALLIGAFSLYKMSSKWQNHKKYIEDRVLSEALRVQFFWNIFKLKFSVSDYVLKIHKKENEWLKHILQSIYGMTYIDIDEKKEKVETVKNTGLTIRESTFQKK